MLFRRLNTGGFMELKCGFVALSLSILFFLSAVPGAQAVPVSKASLLKKGISTVKCPAFAGNPSSGLSTSVLRYEVMKKRNLTELKTLCVKRSKLKEVKKAFSRLESQPLSMNGFVTGTQFAPVVNQEGDVNTDPFQIINYPVIIYYSVDNATFSTEFSIDVIDLETERSKKSLLRGRGPVEGRFAFNIPGEYYLKIRNKADPREQIQPVFTVWMEYMEPYEGFSFEKRDLKDAGIKMMKKCPGMIDLAGQKLISPIKSLVCSKAIDLEEGGAQPAPLNPATQLLMATEIEWAEGGGSITLPFRISAPTALTYSVEDPTEGKGRFYLRLMDLATGKEVKPTLAEVTGSIQETTTFINIPGDYYLFGDTRPYRAEENGDIFWTVSLEASH